MEPVRGNEYEGNTMVRLFLGVGLMLITQSVRAATDVHDPAAVLRVSNESIHRFTLENGVIGVIKPDHSAPLVAIQTWFGTGSIHEDDFLGAGMAHYVEHMIFKGTPTRSPGDISRQISDVGGRVNAYTTFDRTVFHVVMPSDAWAVGLDVLADAVQHASFPEEEWEREQTVILQEMAMNRDDPQRELGRLLWSTAYRVHPHRHPVIGYREVFLQTTRDDLIDFFERHYRPDNMIVAVAGAVDPLAMEQAIRDAFASFERRMRRPVVLPAEPKQMTPRTARQTGAYEVTRAAWAWHTVPLHHPDAPALDILAAVLGRGESSRLTLSLRDRKQLVHHIGAWSYTPAEPGLIGFSAQFDPDREAEVIAAVQTEMERWHDDPFTEAEIDKARRQVLVRNLSELQDMRGQVNAIASGEFYAGDPRFAEQYLTALNEVTPTRLMEVFNQYMRPERQTRVILAPDTATEQRTTAAATPSPLPQRLELDNGIPLIVREDARLPLAHVTVAFLGGTLSETESTQGLSRFMSDLLTRGTISRDAATLVRELDSLGATLQPFSGLNSFGIQGFSLAADVEVLLERLAESLLTPAFDAREIRRQRSRQLADIRAQRERPLSLADQLVRDILYPDHPYRWTPDGAESTVSDFDYVDIRAFWEHHLRTGNMAISVFGHVDAEAIRAQLNELFAAVPVADAVIQPLHVPDVDLPAKVVQREPRQQTIYLMAFPGVDLFDSREVVLDVLQTAMSGLASTLAIEVRDKRGLVYFVGALSRSGLAPGRFMLYAGTFEEAVDEIQALMEQELQRIQTDGLTDEELARAKEQLAAQAISLKQDNATLAQLSALNELYGLGYDHGFTKDERIRAVTHDMIRQAATELLDPDRRIVSIVFPQESSTNTASYEER